MWKNKSYKSELSFSPKEEWIQRQERQKSKSEPILHGRTMRLSSSSHSKNEEQTHISLMTSHHSDGENDEVCDSNDKPSYEELQSAKAF